MTQECFVGEDLNPGAMTELSRIPDGQPFALVNLLRYREWADYPPGTVTKRCSGRQAYERYSELSIPFVNAVGGVPMWRGHLATNLIGPESERWDELLIMQYPSRSAFQRMLDDPGYKAIVFHRTAAVRDSRLFGAIEPQSIGPLKWRVFKLSRKVRGR